MTPRAAGDRRPSQAWPGFQLLLVCLLVVGKPTMAKNCKHVIGAGHLKDLQQLIDSQMESSCQISFEFADRDQLKDPVCYLKKAILLLEDILEENMQFKPNSLNANITQSLQELQLRLMMSCDIKKDKEHSKACVKTFYKTPLQMLVMVKDVFEETKKLLESDTDAFVKDCSSSFTQCKQPDVVNEPACSCPTPRATLSGELADDPTLLPTAAQPGSSAGLGLEETEASSFFPGHISDPSQLPIMSRREAIQHVCGSAGPAETQGPEGGSTLPASSPPAGSPTRPSPPARPGDTLSVPAASPGSEDPSDSTTSYVSSAQGETPGNVGFWDPGDPGSQDPRDVGYQRATVGPTFPGVGPRPVSTAGLDDHLPASAASATDRGAPAGTWLVMESAPSKGEDGPVSPLESHSDPAYHGNLLLHPEELLSPPGSFLGGTPEPRNPPQGQKSTRERRSTAQIRGDTEGGRGGGRGADRGQRVAGPNPDFNGFPLTDTGHKEQRLGPPDLPGLVFYLLVPSVILVLLAVGGLLFYLQRHRTLRELQAVPIPMEQPEISPLNQEEDRRVELPV
ncbi:LOW QUALITY PROTEIN: macrophage colony-stimulating factor 1 [Tachyglossus aculeatus]|uniref:LOW QUALITY PROTEIN: macrophage colony-stimulating factor 1 n=1 Tax=Tachyglossus aculeatus TaxID=9261 RepID=UPI0018F38AD0|nr:LOW QUALITY PROTEIN: macrophage colony-stimulating factor 1 [Tachyglossus aculeatus]